MITVNNLNTNLHPASENTALTRFVAISSSSTEFPVISVIRWDQEPCSFGRPALSALYTYPYFAELVYVVNDGNSPADVVTSRNGVSSSLTADFIALSANNSRKFFIATNNTNATLYLKYGTTAATTAAGGFDIQILSSGASFRENQWTGMIHGICGAAATGSVSFSDFS